VFFFRGPVSLVRYQGGPIEVWKAAFIGLQNWENRGVYYPSVAQRPAIRKLCDVSQRVDAGEKLLQRRYFAAGDTNVGTGPLSASEGVLQQNGYAFAVGDGFNLNCRYS
jgi:hypothetical protein